MHGFGLDSEEDRRKQLNVCERQLALEVLSVSPFFLETTVIKNLKDAMELQPAQVKTRKFIAVKQTVAVSIGCLEQGINHRHE